MRRVWNDALTRAINQQVEFLQHRLSNQNFIPKHKSFFQSVPSVKLKDNRLSNINCIFAAIGTFCDTLSANTETKSLHDLNWNHTANCARVNQRIGLVNANLIERHLSAPHQRFINSISKLNLYSNFAHFFSHLLPLFPRGANPGRA